jgi:hypothetical protein
LFGDGRLTLEALRCFVAAEPLAWERGAADASALLVIENAATWHSYCRWNREHGHFAAVVYGGGNRFVDGVGSLGEVLQALGGARRLLYFGDLDPYGIRIPRLASARAEAMGFPRVEPHFWSYRQLLEMGQGQERKRDDEVEPSPADLEWLGGLAGKVAGLFSRGSWLPQEHLGWEFLEQVLPAQMDAKPNPSVD